MTKDRRREHSASGPIRFWMPIAILLLPFCGTSSCNKNSEPPTDPAPARTDLKEDSEASITDTADGDDERRDGGIFYNGSQGYARAVGRAPKGRDISLARDN